MKHNTDKVIEFFEMPKTGYGFDKLSHPAVIEVNVICLTLSSYFDYILLVSLTNQMI